MSKQPLLATSNESVRHRRSGVSGVTEMVQEFDAFLKVTDDVKEEPKAIKGILSILSFSLIFVLLIGQIYEYFYSNSVEYKFTVDTVYDEKLFLEIDIIVATPCNNLAIMPMGVDSLENFHEKTELKKNPSRFEMNEEETKLWKTLQKVHKEHFKPGTRNKALSEMTFMQNSVEQGLKMAADQKQEMAIEEVKKLKKAANVRDDQPEDNNFVLMMGNGFGVFQVISIADNKNEIKEGTACRINGKVPVLKGNGDRLVISPGKIVTLGNFVTHMNNKDNSGNVSHRIERFNFGPHIWGLVTPLAGNEQIAEKNFLEGGTIYKYYIKVVPTKIYRGGLFNKPIMTYQYSVTYAKKVGTIYNQLSDSIIFDYEFTAMVIEVRPSVM